MKTPRGVDDVLDALRASCSGVRASFLRFGFNTSFILHCNSPLNFSFSST